MTQNKCSQWVQCLNVTIRNEKQKNGGQ